MSSSNPSKDQQQKKPPPRIQLTDEEKAVLVECRRNSIARGLPLGIAAVLTLRWFIHQGRVPLHVKRWTGLYYTGAFMGSFYMGVASYKQQCMDKIMALDNSFIKDQLKGELGKLRSGAYRECYEEIEKATKSQRGGPQQSERTYPPPRQSHPRSTKPAPHTPSPNVQLNEGPAVKTTYEKDKAMLDTREMELEQPDAFSKKSTVEYSADQSASKQQSYQDTHQTRPRGRTYDEIRESARRRDQETPRSTRDEDDWRQQKSQQGRRNVRRNKYGDEVEE